MAIHFEVRVIVPLLSMIELVQKREWKANDELARAENRSTDFRYGGDHRWSPQDIRHFHTTSSILDALDQFHRAGIATSSYFLQPFSKSLTDLNHLFCSGQIMERTLMQSEEKRKTIRPSSFSYDGSNKRQKVLPPNL